MATQTYTNTHKHAKTEALQCREQNQSYIRVLPLVVNDTTGVGRHPIIAAF